MLDLHNTKCVNVEFTDKAGWFDSSFFEDTQHARQKCKHSQYFKYGPTMQNVFTSDCMSFHVMGKITVGRHPEIYHLYF